MEDDAVSAFVVLHDAFDLATVSIFAFKKKKKKEKEKKKEEEMVEDEDETIHTLNGKTFSMFHPPPPPPKKKKKKKRGEGGGRRLKCTHFLVSGA